MTERLYPKGTFPTIGTMSAPKLKPCPFCGCRCEPNQGDRGWVMLPVDTDHAESCPLAYTISSNYKPTALAAKRAWNRRTP